MRVLVRTIVRTIVAAGPVVAARLAATAPTAFSSARVGTAIASTVLIAAAGTLARRVCLASIARGGNGHRPALAGLGP